MATKTSVEKKSKRMCYSVVIVPQYEGCARRFKVSRIAIYGVITAFLLFVTGFVWVLVQNANLKNTVAQYDGMALDQVVRLQSAQLDARKRGHQQEQHRTRGPEEVRRLPWHA